MPRQPYWTLATIREGIARFQRETGRAPRPQDFRYPAGVLPDTHTLTSRVSQAARRRIGGVQHALAWLDAHATDEEAADALCH